MRNKFIVVFSLLVMACGEMVFADVMVPDIKNMRYGPYQDNVLDVYIPRNVPNPPIAIFLHGGGFKSGDKVQVNDAGKLLSELLAVGIAVVSANYRLISSTNGVTLDKVFKEDLTTLVQTLRYRAPSLGLNGNAIGAFGNSAGAGAALWLGVHDDVANPNSHDPAKRVSSKIQVVGHLAGQATYDTEQWSNISEVAPSWAKLIDFEDDLLWFGVTKRAQLTAPQIVAKIQSIDLPSLMSPDDAYLYIENYTAETDIVLTSTMTDAEKKSAKTDISHTPRHAYFLESVCQTNGMFCEIYTENNIAYNRGGMVAFFQAYLQ